MQSSKIEFLTTYNNLIGSSLKSLPNFPDQLCNFIISEFELQAALLFKVNENNSMVLLGKAG
ncbi:MAG TPA: hypothetical protein ENI61_05445, partial [Ignavibacteria bacterium]|nr:hypothetical protein [Ignavibacteria bacterium]